MTFLVTRFSLWVGTLRSLIDGVGGGGGGGREIVGGVEKNIKN